MLSFDLCQDSPDGMPCCTGFHNHPLPSRCRKKRDVIHIKFNSTIHLPHEAASGVLATQSIQLAGYPFALDEQHQPIFLLNSLAEHTQNFLTDSRASLLFSEPGEQNVLESSRLTLVGDIERVEAPDELVVRYLRYQPDTRQYLDLGDFSFVRLTPKRARYIAGFGEMGWVEEKDWRNVAVLSLYDEENLHHEVLPSVPAGVRLLGIDCYGFDVEHTGNRVRYQFTIGRVDQANLSDVLKQFLGSL